MAIGTLKNDLTLAPILEFTTRQGVEGFSVWHNPFFNLPLPHELAQYKAPWEHLQTNFIDNLSDASGTIFSTSTLENYLTEENGVEWHRNQVYITIHYKDKEKIKRVIKADELLSSWAEIIKAIASWCLDIIEKNHASLFMSLPTPLPKGPKYQHPPRSWLTPGVNGS
jgi:hypothetical protein